MYHHHPTMPARNDISMSSSVPATINFGNIMPEHSDLMNSIDSCLSQEAQYSANKAAAHMPNSMAATAAISPDPMFDDALFDVFGQGGMMLDSGGVSDGGPTSPDVDNSEMDYDSQQSRQNSHGASNNVEMIARGIGQTHIHSPQHSI